MKINLFKIFYELHSYLITYGIRFTPDGYPIFERGFILNEIPSEILPFEHRKETKDETKTVLCFFANDKLLYRRLLHLNQDLPIYAQFQGICGFDLSPRIGWKIELQKFNICLSQMVTIYLALHGAKVLPNFRIGEFETLSSLEAYPKDIPFAVGALGCWKKKVSIEEQVYLKMKLLTARPSFLNIYGKIEDWYLDMLKEADIPYKCFTDFRTMCYSKRR